MIKKFKRTTISWQAVMLNFSAMLRWVFCNNEEIRLGRRWYHWLFRSCEEDKNTIFHFKLSRLPPHLKSVKDFVKMLWWNVHFCFHPRWALNIKGVKNYNITVQRRLVWYGIVESLMVCFLLHVTSIDKTLLCHFQNRLDIVQVPWTSVRLKGLSLQVCMIYVKERCPSIETFLFAYKSRGK